MTAFDMAAVRTGDAAAAAGTTAETLQKHIDRGKIRLGSRDKDTTGSGDVRLLSVRRVVNAAVLMHLIRLGIRPSSAAAFAAMAVGEPGGPPPAGWFYRRPGHRGVVVEDFPRSPEGVIVNVTRLARQVCETLAARVPELRAAGIV